MGKGECEMESTIAEKYKATLDALPPEKQSEPLWERPGFEAGISYTPAPYREMIFTFVDGSVFDYYNRWAWSRTEWADSDKFISRWGTTRRVPIHARSLSMGETAQ